MAAVAFVARLDDLGRRMGLSVVVILAENRPLNEAPEVLNRVRMNQAFCVGNGSAFTSWLLSHHPFGFRSGGGPPGSSALCGHFVSRGLARKPSHIHLSSWSSFLGATSDRGKQFPTERV